MHILEAIRYITEDSNRKITHPSWKKGYYVVCSPSGNFFQVTNDLTYSFDWYSRQNPKVGWIPYDQ